MGPEDSTPSVTVPFFERFLERIDPPEGRLVPTATRRDDFMSSV